ncbi:putative 54S ribosomal protein L32, mitochondrial [Mycena indigotica]|uniref:Large ribosomal subunit protein bL32m n=1 Tax=Mycena indigotica TaxID=2126181 RepID=A0A8H6SZ50_9AGAR|nr:putative 54S ribosomal protein L32, mitochondrial [Mycena indigotica]KAF7306957.1 putative 54S ribosomal protein L32, mitochondrial [Mycena indigotica]
MAAIPLLPPLFARPWRLRAFAAVPTLLASVREWRIPSLLELFPPITLAVPKKKVSHSRKAMRQANKGLKDKQNIVSCPGCGEPKLAHQLCPNCYSFLKRMWKSAPIEQPEKM